MKRILVKVKRENVETVEQLKRFGNVEAVSLFMNIFSVEINDVNIAKIRRLPGVLKIENDDNGLLKPIVI